MKKRPTANKFTSAEAIFHILDILEACGTTTVASVRTELRCCDRQARDYLAFLEARGRIKAERRGRTNEYHLVHRGTGGSNELTQAVGTEFAVAAVGALQGTAFHDAASAHVKALRHGLTDVHGPRAERLRSAFHTVRGSVPTNPDHAANAETILDAIKFGHRLRGTYEKLGDGSMVSYNLRPIAVVVHHEGLHLLARKRDGKVRTFDIEGFRTIERVKRATPPPDFDTAGYFANAFGRYTDYPAEDVVLRLRGVAARLVSRRRFHSSQCVVTADAGTLTITFRIGVCPEFISWLLGMAAEIEVLSPTGLREEVRRLHSAAAARNEVG